MRIGFSSKAVTRAAAAASTSAGTGWSFHHRLWHDALAGETGTPGGSK
jgi:hypothetical protein